MSQAYLEQDEESPVLEVLEDLGFTAERKDLEDGYLDPTELSLKGSWEVNLSGSYQPRIPEKFDESSYRNKDARRRARSRANFAGLTETETRFYGELEKNSLNEEKKDFRGIKLQGGFFMAINPFNLLDFEEVEAEELREDGTEAVYTLQDDNPVLKVRAGYGPWTTGETAAGDIDQVFRNSRDYLDNLATERQQRGLELHPVATEETDF